MLNYCFAAHVRPRAVRVHGENNTSKFPLPDMELVSDLAMWFPMMVCPGIPYAFCMIVNPLGWFWLFRSRSQNSRSTSPISVEARELAGLITSVVDEDDTSELLSSGATLTACSPDHRRFIVLRAREGPEVSQENFFWGFGHTPYGRPVGRFFGRLSFHTR